MCNLINETLPWAEFHYIICHIRQSVNVRQIPRRDTLFLIAHP